jgi:hypothetical protein
MTADSTFGIPHSAFPFILHPWTAELDFGELSSSPSLRVEDSRVADGEGERVDISASLALNLWPKDRDLCSPFTYSGIARQSLWSSRRIACNPKQEYYIL